MNDKAKENIDLFLDDEENDTKINKKEVIKEKDGLIERIDKKYVTKEGKMLLREIYY